MLNCVIVNEVLQSRDFFLKFEGDSMTQLIAAILLLVSTQIYANPVHHCANDALKRAQSLLHFHFDDERIDIAKSVKSLASIHNPANPKQLFDVLEVWGYIYKGQYRMRFIYAQFPQQCVLMGQEILEYAVL